MQLCTTGATESVSAMQLHEKAQAESQNEATVKRKCQVNHSV